MRNVALAAAEKSVNAQGTSGSNRAPAKLRLQKTAARLVGISAIRWVIIRGQCEFFVSPELESPGLLTGRDLLRAFFLYLVIEAANAGLPRRSPMSLFTIITPTIGRPTLDVLIESIDRQPVPGATFHLLLWDDFRDPGSRQPESYNGPTRHSIVLPAGSGKNGEAPGSPLRAIGLMAARTPLVTFADDDVYWAPNHLAAITSAILEKRWASTLRTVWTAGGERLGVDRFEAVGDDPTRRAPYETMDNNCLAFTREFGVRAAWMYRETVRYNDDRQMYEFLKRHAGPRGRTDRATVHQICPDRLIDMFRSNCSPD